MEYLYNNLGDALTDLGWFHIDNIETSVTDGLQEIRSVFNPSELDDDGSPKITTEDKTILVLDNHDYNETYLIDLVSKVLKKQNYKPGQYHLILIDNVTIRKYIEQSAIITYFKEEEYKAIERTLHSQVIVVNPNTNCMVHLVETFGPIVEDQVENILKWLDDEYCIKNK